MEKVPSKAWHCPVAHVGFPDTSCFPELNEAPSKGICLPLPFNFSVPFHFPHLASKVVHKCIQQIFTEYLLVPGTIVRLKEKAWGEQRELGSSLSQPYISSPSESTSTFSPIIRHLWTCPAKGPGLLIRSPGDTYASLPNWC